MNNHKTACMLLLVLVALMLYGVNSLRNATSKAREISQLSQSEAESAEQSAQLAEIQLKTLDSKTAELRLLYGEWKPYFDSHQNPQDAERKRIRKSHFMRKLLGENKKPLDFAKGFMLK